MKYILNEQQTSYSNNLNLFKKDDIVSIQTIDVEGDSLHRSINKKLFPNGCHFDPGTRLWSVSITMRNLLYSKEEIINQGLPEINVYTYVCKLPNTPRMIYDYNGRIIGRTVAIHEKSTIVPHCKHWRGNIIHPEIAYNIVEIPDYVEFLTKVANVIDNVMSRPDPLETVRNQPIISKGYGNYNYDYIALKNACDKYGVKFDGSNMISINAPQLGTHKEITPGQFVNNQKYFYDGLQHNIEDSIELNEFVYKQIRVGD